MPLSRDAESVVSSDNAATFSVCCLGHLLFGSLATRLYLPQLTKRLHACIFKFVRGVWFLLLYVRSEKNRLCFALRALGAIVKLLKIRSRLGQPGPGLSSAGYLPRSLDFPCYGFLRRPGQPDSRTSYLRLIRLGCPDSQTAYL